MRLGEPEPVGRSDRPAATLERSRLVLARVVWVAVALLTAALFVASIPAHLAATQEVCPAEPCLAGQLASDEARALGELGISTGAYAAYGLVLDLIVALEFCAVGVLVFWRRSRERGALFVSFALVVFGLTWPEHLRRGAR